jgi:Sulfatase
MNRPAASLSAALLFVFTIFVYGPFTLYQGNVDEFSIPLRSILTTLLIPALALFLILVLLGLAPPKKAHQVYVSLLFALGVLVWLQGNLLVWKYGLLNGQGIVWSKGAWRGWVDGVLWVVLLAAAAIFFKKVYRFAAFGSIALTVLLLASLIFTSVQKPETWSAKDKSLKNLVPPKEVFEFSTRQNVIHFILDGFQSDFFAEIVAANPDRYCKALDGFTFFSETTGLFPTTYMSIPAFLSGRIYKNDIPMRKFVIKAIRGRTIANRLHEQGFETDLVSDSLFARGARAETWYKIAVPYGGTIGQYLKSNSAVMLDLVLFRHVPHFLKKFIYNDEQWLVQRLLRLENKTLGIRYFSHQAFLSDLIAKMSVNRSAPVYKYVHLMTTHPPVVVDKDCRYAQNLPGTRENIMAQAKCSLDHFLEFLDKLREKGIYDSSLIVLHADHGLGRPVPMRNQGAFGQKDWPVEDVSLAEVAGSAAALLAVKPPFSQGPLKTSRAPVSLTDIAATICSLLDLSGRMFGRSVFEVDENEARERWFYFYHWRHENWQSTYFPRLDEFSIAGSLFDEKSWRLNSTFYPPAKPKK